MRAVANDVTFIQNNNLVTVYDGAQPVCNHQNCTSLSEFFYIDRLEKYKDAVLMFSKNMAVPFTNNIAEQGIRNLKVKVKVAGCFRSKDGAEHYAMIRSYVESARKHGVNAYEAIKFAFLGTPQVCFKF